MLVNRSSDRFYTRGMIHNKIHLISPCCPRPSIASTVQSRGLKHHSFIHSFPNIYVLFSTRMHTIRKIHQKTNDKVITQEYTSKVKHDQVHHRHCHRDSNPVLPTAFQLVHDVITTVTTRPPLLTKIHETTPHILAT